MKTLPTFAFAAAVALLVAPVALAGQTERGALNAVRAHQAFADQAAPIYGLTGETIRDYRTVKATEDARAHRHVIHGGRSR